MQLPGQPERSSQVDPWPAHSTLSLHAPPGATVPVKTEPQASSIEEYESHDSPVKVLMQAEACVASY